MLLCAARLGMRSKEVAQLRLDDVDWRVGTVRVRTRKTGRGALLPLSHEVGEAIADYLRQGRPTSEVREVFVLHRHRVDSRSIVTSSATPCAVRFATRR